MALSQEEELELVRLLEEQHYELARQDLATFAEHMLGMPPARHHHLLCDGLTEIERGLLDLLIVMMPPGSAKSTYGSVVFPMWYMGRHPTDNIIAASNVGELAERFGRKVRNGIGSPEYEKIFPRVKVAEDSSAAGRWETNQGGEYYAVGIGGAVTGRRGDIAIIDDPVKSREEAESQTIRDKQWAWWRDDLRTRLKPGGRVVVIMTRWHEDDLVGRILEDLKDSTLRVKVLKVQMEAGPDDPLGREVGELLWPEWFTPKMLEEAKRDARTFTSLYQQEPRPIGGGDFKREWFCFYKRTPATGNRILLVDPASGKRRDRGDFTSMWVLGRGADTNYYVLDGVRDRLNLVERTDAVIDLVRKWKISDTFYEEYGLQADIEHIKAMQELRQFRFRVRAIGGPMPKVDRIRRLIGPLQTGQLWLPERLDKQCTDGHVRDIIRDLIDELLAFPVAKNDDAGDCLARMLDDLPNRTMQIPSPQSQQARVQTFVPLDPEMGF